MFRRNKILFAVFALFVCQTAFADGIVSAINKAPVASDGTTAGRTTDFVINLDTSLDPSVSGRTLLEGKTIRITLPEGFENTLGYAFGSPGTICGPPLSGDMCNTGVLLQGWPQHPVPPPMYSLSYEAATNTIVFMANTDIASVDALAPGIKQMHLILLGFTNPHPGHYPVYVEAETGPSGEMETGWGRIHIIPKSRPSINVTSTGGDNPGTLNTIYQETTVGSTAPLAYNFLLWDRRDNPFGGVDLVDLDGSGNYLLMKGDKVVGHASIDSPDGATGQMLMSSGPSAVTATPVFGPPSMTARWIATFMAGSAPGVYAVNVKLNNGNEVTMHVNATP